MDKGIDRRDLVIALGAAVGSTSLLTSGLAVAQGNSQRKAARAGVANFVNGEASIADGDAQPQTLTSGTVIKQGQAIETSASGEVHIVFDDGGMLALRPSSRVLIDQAQIAGSFSDALTMTLLRGALRSISGWIGKFDRSSYQLRTPTATVGIRGTDHELAIIPDGEEKKGETAGVHNWVHEGGTTLSNAGGHTDVEPGHAAWAAHNGQAPQPHQGIPPYLQKRATSHERRINAHAQHVTEHIEKRMQKRGMIKAGETLKDAQQRHQAQRGNTVEEPAKPKQNGKEEARRKRRHPRA